MRIILNGPPGSGKDTIANHLEGYNSFEVYSFKKHLIEIALLTSRVDYIDWWKRYNDRDLKDTPWDVLGGLSQRQYLIKISEEWIKPVHGESYFGDILAHEIKYEEADVVISDSGFDAEAVPVIQLGDTLVVYLYRDGCSYEGDSRSYLSPSLGSQTVTVHNNGTVLEAMHKILKAASDGGLKRKNK